MEHLLLLLLQMLIHQLIHKYKMTLTSKSKFFFTKTKNLFRTKVEKNFWSLCAKLYNSQVVHILECTHSRVCAGFYMYVLRSSLVCDKLDHGCSGEGRLAT